MKAPVHRVGSAFARALETRPGYVLASWINRLPVPRWVSSVRVGPDVLRGHRWDRILALWFWKWGWRERAETQWVRTWLRAGMAAVDAGANVGLFTLLMAHRVGPSGRVLAFEPDPGNFASLVENLRRNRAGHVDARCQALGSTQGVGRLDPSAANAGDHRVQAAPPLAGGEVGVDIVTLDSAWPPDQPLDLIKMDIQGAEAEALLGMERTWRSQERLVMLLEFWPQGLRESGSDPTRFLKDLREQSGLLRTLRPDGTPGPAVDSSDPLLEEMGENAAIPLLAGPRAAVAMKREVPKV